MQEIFGYRFREAKLLERALTHKSIHPLENYERLEFLGDSILNFFITRFIFERFPQEDLKELAYAKRYLVSNEFLSSVARKLGIEKMAISKRRISDGFLSGKILADMLESIFAGIFLDSENIELTYEIFKNAVGKEIERAYIEKAYIEDYKTALLRLCKEKFNTAPTYKVVAVEGPNIVVECKVLNYSEIAEGFNKAVAEQNSAKKMLQRLGL